MAQKRKLFAVLLLLFLALKGDVFALEQAEEGDVLWDGLEQQNSWGVNKECELSLSSEYATEGRTSLKVNLSGTTSPEIVTVKRINTRLDLNSADKVVFDIFNSGAPFQITLVLYTDQRYESFPKQIDSGLNENITFELNSADFKFILTPEKIAQAIEFVIYPGKGEMQPFYLDNIRVKQLSGLESLFLPGISPALKAAFDNDVMANEEANSYIPAYGVAAFPSRSTTSVLPEPKTLLLLSIGLFGLYFMRR
ncbi:MAG: PEP-CTERM sorting domain-containing protein [Candidatus Omnitrophota bacterium]